MRNSALRKLFQQGKYARFSARVLHKSGNQQQQTPLIFAEDTDKLFWLPCSGYTHPDQPYQAGNVGCGHCWLTCMDWLQNSGGGGGDW